MKCVMCVYIGVFTVRFACGYNSSPLPFIADSLNQCFRSFQSLFEYISIDYKGRALKLNYFVLETVLSAALSHESLSQGTLDFF